jgi:transcriptional regulator with XRE-family HTH domain
MDKAHSLARPGFLGRAERAHEERGHPVTAFKVENHSAITRAVGEELRRARDDRGWSRPDLVRRLRNRLPVNTYACYEQGIRQVSIPRLVELCETLGVAAPDLLGLALQRAEVDPRTSGVRVDLHKVVADKRDMLRLLRRWARHRLKNDIDDSGVTRLEWSFINEMAVFLGLSGPELLGYLREFAPEAPPQR